MTLSNVYLILFIIIISLSSQTYCCMVLSSRNVLASDIHQLIPTSSCAGCIFRFETAPSLPLSPDPDEQSMRNKELKKSIVCPCVCMDLSDTSVWKGDCSWYP